MFTQQFTIPDYGWKVSLFEPTMDESGRLADSWDKSDWPTVYPIVASLVESWDCTDRSGKTLPKTAEGVARLPLTVLRYLVNELYTAIADKSQLKNDSKSLPTTAPGREVTK